MHATTAYFFICTDYTNKTVRRIMHEKEQKPYRGLLFFILEVTKRNRKKIADDTRYSLMLHFENIVQYTLMPLFSPIHSHHFWRHERTKYRHELERTYIPVESFCSTHSIKKSALKMKVVRDTRLIIVFCILQIYTFFSMFHVSCMLTMSTLFSSFFLPFSLVRAIQDCPLTLTVPLNLLSVLWLLHLH